MSATLPDNLVPELSDVAARVVELCRAAGADEAEVLVRDGSELTVKVRMGQPELVQEAGSRAIGLRVFKGGRRAVTYSSDLRDKPLAAFVAESVALAELSEPDEHGRLPDREEPVSLDLAQRLADLQERLVPADPALVDGGTHGEHTVLGQHAAHGAAQPRVAA